MLRTVKVRLWPTANQKVLLKSFVYNYTYSLVQVYDTLKNEEDTICSNDILSIPCGSRYSVIKSAGRKKDDSIIEQHCIWKARNCSINVEAMTMDLETSHFLNYMRISFLCNDYKLKVLKSGRFQRIYVCLRDGKWYANILVKLDKL